MSSAKTNIIFESNIKGHVLEYLHNIYMHVIHCEGNFVFILPHSFETLKSILNWPEASNVTFYLISDEEAAKCNQQSVLKSAFERSRCIRKYSKLLNADNVFLIFLIRAMPFLPFFLPRSIKASGIIYSIPLYKPSQSKVQSIKDRIVYCLFARRKEIKNIFMLNDSKSVVYYNRKYRTDKFLNLLDPIPEIDMSKVKDLRDDLGIPKNNTVYLQFGSLENRKSTMKILYALKSMSTEQLKGKTFIFMGRLYDTIREEFNELIEVLNKKVQIIVKEGFVPYEYLNSMCYTADVILTLYTNVEMSSGSIGYAAFFSKPVIAPSVGLLGNLVKDNNLGLTINHITPESIKQALLVDVKLQKNDYKYTHTVKAFCDTIINTFK